MWLERTENLIGKNMLDMLSTKTVAVFGIGGVGSYAVEGLARAGLGHLILVDGDVVASSNLNRQLIALTSTIGQKKVEVAKNRLLDINPNLKIETYDCYFDAQTESRFDFSCVDYVLDAIDMVSSKILLVEKAKQSNTKIICSMGTGNKLNQNFQISDISKTEVCPLAKVLRKEFKSRGIKDVKVLWSRELPIKPFNFDENARKQTPASISFVPSVAGLMIAGEVIRDFLKENSI